MRIALDATSIDQQCAGIGYYVKEHLYELIQACPQHEFYLYVFEKAPIYDGFSAFSNVRINPIKRFSFSHALWVQASLPFALRRDNIDLFWGSTQSIPLLCPKKTKTVLTIHDFVYLMDPTSMTPLLRNYFKFLMPKMLKKAGFLLTNSEGTAMRLEIFYDYICHGYLLPPLKTSLKLTEKKISEENYLSQKELRSKAFLIVVGTIEPRKNFEQILTIYQNQLKNASNIQEVLPLVIIGGGGWKNRNIIRQLNELRGKYPKHLKVLGYLPDTELAIIMKNARYLVMLSHYEGYGMPLAEARVMGTSVISTDIMEMREAAEGDGIFISPSDIDQELPQYFMKDLPYPQKVTTNYPTNKEKIESMLQIIEKIDTKIGH